MAAAAFLLVRFFPSPSGPVRPGSEAVADHPAAAARSTEEPFPALAAAARETDPLRRRLRFLELVENADPAELRRMYLGGRISSREKRDIAQRWAETDPAGMFEFLKSTSRAEWDRNPAQNDLARDLLFRAWARRDPEAALAAATSLRTRPHFRRALGEVASATLEFDLSKGFAALAALPSDVTAPLRDSVWKDDPAGFLQAAGAGSPDVLRHGWVRHVVNSAFTEWVRRDSAAAAAWLTERPPEQQRHLWSRLAFRLAEIDPTRDARYLDSLRQMPEPFRAIARDAVAESPWGTDNRKQRAIEALK